MAQQPDGGSQQPWEHTAATRMFQAHIRRARPLDLDVITDFNIAMAKETEGLDLQPQVLRAGVEAVLQGRPAARYYVICEGSEVVGQLMLTFEWSDWRCKDVWWIQSVYVAPPARRRGHFKALYAHVRAEAVAQGAAGLRLYADNTNVTAHATYEKLGMSGDHYRVFEDMFA